MEAHYPKYVLYGLLILGSWLVSSLLHFQLFHLSLPSAAPRRSPSLVVLPAAHDARLIPPPPAVAEADDDRRRPLSSSPLPAVVVEADDGRQQPPSSSKCEGRYVYMLDIPERFNMLKDCVEGSPLFDDIWSWCAITVNGGMGPRITSANGTDIGIIPSTGW
jgi:xyloglucan galactosyltransferase MUR3